MMAVLSRPTIALVYHDEVLLLRNRTKGKLEARGLVIKKLYSCESKRFDFSTVDAVVAIIDGIRKPTLDHIERLAHEADRQFFALPHQVSRGWDVLDELTTRSPSSLRAPPAVASTRQVDPVDPDTREIFALLEKERDEAREATQRANGELGNVRAERDRLLAELQAAKGELRSLEVQAEQGKMGAGELQAQRSAWASQLEAAHRQNKALAHDLSAMRERAERAEREAAQASREQSSGMRPSDAPQAHDLVMAFIHGAGGAFRGGMHDLRDAIHLNNSKLLESVRVAKDKGYLVQGKDSEGLFFRCTKHDTCRVVEIGEPRIVRVEREPLTPFVESVCVLVEMVRLKLMTEAEAFTKLIAMVSS